MGELNNIRQVGAAAAMRGAMELLSFTIGKEEYAIDIQKVQELRGYAAPTCVANAPDFLKGVLNLRGAIVPIVDMRIKFKPTRPLTTISPWSSSSTSGAAPPAWWSTACRT